MSVVIARSELLRLLRRAGHLEAAEELADLLPDPVDVDRAGDLLLQHGISRDVLLDRLGGSP